MNTKKSNTIKTLIKSPLNKKLLPPALVERYKKIFMENGFTSDEVDNLIRALSYKILEVEERVNELKKYAGLPTVKLEKCPCPHNGCSVYSIKGINICSGYVNVLRVLPDIETDGVNVGMIWSALKKNNMANDSIKITLNKIMSKFSPADRAKIYKKLPEVKKVAYIRKTQKV